MTKPDDLPPRSRAALRQAWTQRLARFATAGLTVTQFCAAEGVSVQSFYLWRRRLAPPTSPPNVDRTPTLLPVHLTATPTAPLELLLPTGTLLRVASGADPATLAHLLRLLGVLPC